MRIRQLMVVHTSRAVREFLQKIILSDGGDIEISQAANGQEASDLLKREWFDLVLTDIGMTDLQLDQIKSEFTSRSKNKKLAIIALAGGDSPEEIAALEANGLNQYVVPPFEPAMLNKKINTLCNPRQWRKAARYHFPESNVIINVWGMEADARLINLSQGGVLVEAAGDRSELFLQNNPKLTIKIKWHHGYYDIENIPAKLARMNTLEWSSNYKPSVMRMVYVFLDMDPISLDALEQILEAAAENQFEIDQDSTDE